MNTLYQFVNRNLDKYPIAKTFDAGVSLLEANGPVVASVDKESLIQSVNTCDGVLVC